ncbi:DUF6320 domain-containing protein [Chryseosolibacter indicus]|uniref:Zinc ribbon domain-containing protein n=1 Tax=Chryseosolibacter indicus TaxID=2782351 RepID=A0ABS5VYH8_9BACT|nr:DUF6320 domain-containing protein [Chryseosolibacter indicus]MBT1706356.1 hypothetical protein [Chryseosolibacter indicus]
MVICRECGVELEDDMINCPLCETPLTRNIGNGNITQKKITRSKPEVERKYALQRVLWQVTSVLLLSGIVSTLIIDLSVHGEVIWSVYPVSICMLCFSYASILSFWRSKLVYQLLAGWVISTFILLAFDFYMPYSKWLIHLSLPILCALNVVVIPLIVILYKVKRKGLNVLALIFVAITLICLIIDGIVSVYFLGAIKLQWSIIVAACLLPVVAALLFMYLRTRDNADLQKIFHT